jgi:hypothetical protein
MVRGVTTVAKRDEVRGLIRSSGRTRDQMMDVRFAPFAWLAARPANMAIASKNDFPDFTPALVLLAREVGC